MTASIWWARRDLRLGDNQALAAALARAGTVIPVFILDPRLLAAPDVSDRRVAFLFGGLRALDADLRVLGSRLVVRRGEPADELARLAVETGAAAIYAEEDPWPYARQRDARVAAELPLHLTPGVTVLPSGAVRKADGTPYTVFTPFSRAWRALPLPSAASLLPTPERLAPLPDALAGVTIPDEPALPTVDPFPPGETAAQRRLHVFGPPAPRSWGDPFTPEIGSREAVSPIYAYADGRNRLERDGTSQLSPYLRFGMISPRQAAVAALEAMSSAPDEIAARGAETWLSELIWREFYMAILYHFPHVLEQAFRGDLRDIPWRNDPIDFAAWCEGRTGYPVVDAGMRQLVQTGWMHNRARMIAASFLVKDLLVDWRWGERFFMQHLIDGDPAANNGGWQWTAGVGTDAAPYFRVFNPGLQGAKFDPDGGYVRRWVPELARVPAKTIHEPWKSPPEVQRASGCAIGRDYPMPIVDHALSRERVLAAYARSRGESRSP